jgi:hypothetical protein
MDELIKIENHLAIIDMDLNAALSKIRLAKNQLDKELQDVNDLENISIKSLFYKTLGSKEKQVEKERQEYLNAALHYKELNKGIELLEFEKTILSKKILRKDVLTEQLNVLKEKREKEIYANNNHTTTKLKEIVLNLEKNSAKGRAVNDAISEGDKSLNQLNIVLKFLRKANDWGRWDMYTKNKSAGYMKHQAIDKAIRNLTNTQHQLNKFSRELSNLGNQYYTFNLNISQFNKFLDFFFDNLISDWIVQKKIRTSLSNIENTYSKVQRLIIELKGKKVIIEQGRKELLNSKNKLVLSFAKS